MQENRQEDKAAVSDCLSPVEVSAFASDVCTLEEKERYLKHVEGCPECYDKWVTLMMFTHKQQTRSDERFFIHIFSKRIHLVAILSAAAMVAGFLFLVKKYYI